MAVFRGPGNQDSRPKAAGGTLIGAGRAERRYSGCVAEAGGVPRASLRLDCTAPRTAATLAT